MHKLLMFLIVLMVGCASMGNNFALDDADKIKNGMTKDEVIATMRGQRPYSVTNESFTYLYSRANGITGSNSVRKFTVIFDENGKVKNVPPNGYFGEISKYSGERPW